MAADSSMGFHQGIFTSTSYNPHMVSFQSGVVNSNPRTSSRGTSNSVCTSGNAAPFLSGSHGMVNNMSGISPSRSSLGGASIGSIPKYKYVTGSPSDWSSTELAVLKQGLIRYAHKPNIIKYIKIAAMLPTRTIRDVALRCWWNTNRENNRRRKPKEHYAVKKTKEIKENVLASTSMIDISMRSMDSVDPSSFLMNQLRQNHHLSTEVHVVDDVTQHLLEENNQLLSHIAAKLDTFKVEDNTDLLMRTSNNIKAILIRMNEMPGIMCRMPPLPVSVDEAHLSSVLQLTQMVASYGLPLGSHSKQEPRR